MASGLDTGGISIDASPRKEPGFWSVGRFLYTQNPFYLLSCFLILYGLQIATISRDDLVSRTLFLASGIAAYTLLMAVTSIAVVRLCKIWEDARSILLVVIISIVALSAAIDELCITSWNTAFRMIAAGGLFSIFISEVVIRGCSIRLPSWYRLSYYSLIGIFFATPVLLGYAVTERYDALANWGSVLFSCAIAAGLLLLVPAMRQRVMLVRHNGTPWKWPLYPLSAFVILIVLAGIRTHAIWMSFGFNGGSVQFEPFLLLPIVLACHILFAEIDAGRRRSPRANAAMIAAPSMVLLGLSRDGMTHLPIGSDLQWMFGSSTTIALIAVLAFYVYLWRRGVPKSEYAVVACFVGMSLFADLPETAKANGFASYMFLALGSFVCLLICMRHWNRDVLWFGLTILTTATIAMTGHHYNEDVNAIVLAGIFATISMLAIGAVFDSDLAQFLRYTAGATLALAAGCLLAWHFEHSGGVIPTLALAATALLSIGYLQIVRRLGWLYVFGVQVTCLLGIATHTLYGWGAFDGGNLPIQSGIACFAIGITITSFKTGIYHRLKRPIESAAGASRRYKPGL